MTHRFFSRLPFHPVRAASLLAAAALLPVLTLRAADPLPVTEPEHSATPPPMPPMPRTSSPERDSKAPRTAETAVTPNNRNFSRHQDFMERIKEGPIDLLFLGDSITDFWNRRGEWSWEKFAPYHPANFGVGGERTEDVLWRITHGELEEIHPRVTVLLIGTNNIGQSKDEHPGWAAAGVRKIVATLHEKLPQTKVLLLGVFPRDRASSPYRQQIKEINADIAKLDDGDKTRYLDIGKAFLDPAGEIPRDVMSDGLHPSPKRYILWYNAMYPLLDEMMK